MAKFQDMKPGVVYKCKENRRLYVIINLTLKEYTRNCIFEKADIRCNEILQLNFDEYEGQFFINEVFKDGLRKPSIQSVVSNNYFNLYHNENSGHYWYKRFNEGRDAMTRDELCGRWIVYNG